MYMYNYNISISIIITNYSSGYHSNHSLRKVKSCCPTSSAILTVYCKSTTYIHNYYIITVNCITLLHSVTLTADHN